MNLKFKQGNTYNLKAEVAGLDITTVQKVVFKFNNIVRTYLSDGTGDVEYDSINECFIVRLEQEDTLSMNENVKAEVAVKDNRGERKGSKIINTETWETIIDEVI